MEVSQVPSLEGASLWRLHEVPLEEGALLWRPHEDLYRRGFMKAQGGFTMGLHEAPS